MLRSNENNFTALVCRRGLLAVLFLIMGCSGGARTVQGDASSQVAARRLAAAPADAPAPTFGEQVAEPNPLTLGPPPQALQALAIIAAPEPQAEPLAETPRSTRAAVTAVTSPPVNGRATDAPPPPQTAPPTQPPPPPPPTTVVASGPAADLAGRVNAVRAARGLAALGRDASLDAAALGWARSMAASGVLAHSNLPNQLLGKPWVHAGENVGYGPSVQVVHDALVASPGHLANIVGSQYRAIGVGAVIDANGRLWVAQLFAG